MHSDLHMKIIVIFPVFYCTVGFILSVVRATDILAASETITDGLTLVSARNRFEFGFFSPPNSRKRYLGIWCHGMTPQTIVWVANRNSSLNDSLGAVSIVKDGNLILRDGTGKTVWSTDIQEISSSGTVLQLLDSGNLVLRHDDKENDEGYIWQSFDNFTDTWLPGMKLGRDSRTGINRKLTSWKSMDDPSSGQFTYGISGTGRPLEVQLWKGNSLQFRTGPFNGVGFSGVISIPPPIPAVFNPTIFVNTNEVYYEVPESSPLLARIVVSYSGEIYSYLWNSSSSLEWIVIYSIPIDSCDNYGYCGTNSICTINDPFRCSCLTGYVPKSPQDWEIGLRSNGCLRKQPLNCSKGEGFMEVKGVKVPDHWLDWMDSSATLKECEEECLKNCTCTAYANSNVSGRGSGCFFWYGDLIDIRRLATPSNQNIYIRVEAADLGSNERKKTILVVVPCSVVLALLVLTFWFILFKRSRRRGLKPQLHSGVMEDLSLPTFEMMTIAKATNNFSNSNKIGVGGFGPVYKGQLPTGQEIAVKRLSIDSNQGLAEFKNEVIVISKLQHRNLVKLLGCCIQGEERMLIYEYMPSKSLDIYIYDSTRRKLLTWTCRFDIITGIARGLIYLHRDSRLRIIHRDLKASNILLDREMSPKISDFGIARAFGGDQSPEKTTRVIGTYGYMSPEYVTKGLYSTKSDVFSFGVLVLEIVSGRKNRDFHHPEHNHNLLGHAWKLWSEGNACQLIDEVMEESFSVSEVERCIQVGLLCGQQHPEDRPTMSIALSMLNSETALLPQPKRPGFYSERTANETEDSMDKQQQQHPATNDMTITLSEGR
ncbi:G-type lectin S-receptor-like serine/threonine-protein kinase At4g27290 [Coffea arabica]|uniref:Receptor-like serine/threonine-protein kinase n=1 Tax=Coffea arabica TaxID=13443 RepID=A0ABM4WT55_COFAR